MAENPQPNEHIKPEETIQVTIPKHHRAKLAALLDADDVVEHHVHGFANFLREFGVIGLAVGFVAGTQVNGVVKQLLESFFTPLFKLFFGKSLQSRTFTLSWHTNHQEFAWGAFVYALINLLFILVAVYVAIKLFKLDRFKKVDVPLGVIKPESTEKK